MCYYATTCKSYCHYLIFRELHKKRYQTHKNEISHSAIEMLSLPSNHIEACVPGNKLSTVYYFDRKNRPHSDL